MIQDPKIIESISEEVHKAWMSEKIKQGFHSPNDCKGYFHKNYLYNNDQAIKKPTVLNNPKYYKWCDKCHTDLYPYNELRENIKDYDRVTVRAVLEAIDKVGGSLNANRN